jgi:hypothetical protein
MSGVFLTNHFRYIHGNHGGASPSLWSVCSNEESHRRRRVVREGDYPIKESFNALTRRLRTTPGQMRFASATTALLTIVVSVAAIAVLHTRHDATRALASVAQPSLLHASNAYASFSDADATASVAFLTGDLDLLYRRDRYISDLSKATAELAAISRTAGATAAVQDSIFAINAQLPTYTGLVETARSNNRQGFPVGAAYLRQASETMRAKILPEVLSIYRVEAGKLGVAYDSGANKTGPLFLLVIASALVLFMIGLQFWLAGRTHRILNLGWLAATIVTAAVATAVGLVITSNTDGLQLARQRGSDATAELSTARILALRAQADESLALIARGSGTSFAQDFQEVARRLRTENRSGIGAQVQERLRDLGSEASATALEAELAAFFQEHQKVFDLENEGQFREAIKQTSGGEAPHLDLIVKMLDNEITASQLRFTAAINGASFEASAMYFGVALGAVLVCVSIGAGIYPRLREYR